MVYDFETDIRRLTREDTLDVSIINWAVAFAKDVYAPGEVYDEDLSNVDNRLVAMLASSFVMLYVDGIDIPTTFRLDEFTIENDNQDSSAFIFLKMFNDWLTIFQSRGVALQYVDSASSILVTEYDASLYAHTRTLPDGLEA